MGCSGEALGVAGTISRLRSAALAVAVVLALAGCSGSQHSTGDTGVAPRDNPPTTTQAPERQQTQTESPARMALGLPALRSGPVPGYVLIADRDNGRIMLVSPDKKRVVWRYTGLQDPDDAFFTPDYRRISTNEEYDQTIKLLSLKKHSLVWRYGHPGVRGSSPGYLSNPDDASVLQNGLVMVADIQNCRVLFINRHHRIVREIGHAGNCAHDPPATLSSPNGATPLPDGGVLVTEIGGWVDRISRWGRLLYTVRIPTTYPSDAQLLPNGNLLVAGFNTPGRVDEITSKGRVVWTFGPTGYWSLDRPSLAVRWPNGKIAITDDWHHRVLVVDERTKKVVWSYGHLDHPGTAPGYLNKPDGLDVLPAAVAGKPAAAPASPAGGLVKRIGTLPQPVSKAAAVAFPTGELLVLGGLVNGSSTDQILAGAPSSLHAAGSLPAPTHDAAAAVVDGKALLFGGGESVSTNSIVAVSPRGAARRAGALDEPLSDLGGVTLDRQTYLVGGYTGTQYASAVLRYEHGKTVTVSRLREGTGVRGCCGARRSNLRGRRPDAREARLEGLRRFLVPRRTVLWPPLEERSTTWAARASFESSPRARSRPWLACLSGSGIRRWSPPATRSSSSEAVQVSSTRTSRDAPLQVSAEPGPGRLLTLQAGRCDLLNSRADARAGEARDRYLTLDEESRDTCPRQAERALVDEVARRPAREELRVEPVEALDLEVRVREADRPAERAVGPGTGRVQETPKGGKVQRRLLGPVVAKELYPARDQELGQAIRGVTVSRHRGQRRGVRCDNGAAEEVAGVAGHARSADRAFRGVFGCLRA